MMHPSCDMKGTAMKIIVCLNAATLDEANIARALLGRTFGPEFRPLEQSAVSTLLHSHTFAFFAEVELPDPDYLDGFPVVLDADLPPTCMIVYQHSHSIALLCLRCGAVSYNPADVWQRYCARCHTFHQKEIR